MDMGYRQSKQADQSALGQVHTFPIQPDGVLVPIPMILDVGKTGLRGVDGDGRGRGRDGGRGRFHCFCLRSSTPCRQFSVITFFFICPLTTLMGTLGRWGGISGRPVGERCPRRMPPRTAPPRARDWLGPTLQNMRQVSFPCMQQAKHHCAIP